MNKSVNQEIAKKVLAVVDQGLTQGEGVPEPGKMCVEAAVCFAMGLEHSDKPTCVGHKVNSVKIALNDDLPWANDLERSRGLREISVLQLGSNKINQHKFERLSELRTAQNLFAFFVRSEKNKNKKKAYLILAGEYQTAGDFNDLCDFVGINLSFEGLPSEMGQYVILNHRKFRKLIIKIVVDSCCQALRELKSPGAKLWDKLPPSIRKKPLSQKAAKQLLEKLGGGGNLKDLEKVWS